MARVYTKIGDVFAVKLDDGSRKFFQLIAYDRTQLTSDVIRAFKQRYPINEKPNLAEIVSGEVEFYAHCTTSLGVKMDLWEKVGSIKEIGETKHILFRDSDDYGDKVDVSYRWIVWRINEKVVKVGKLKGENRKAEIGVVVNPEGIVDRIKTGKYNFRYPGFEQESHPSALKQMLERILSLFR